MLLKLYQKINHIRRDLGPVPDVLGELPKKLALGISWKQLEREFDEKMKKLVQDPAYGEFPMLKDVAINPPSLLPNQHVREYFVKKWIQEFGGECREKDGEWRFKIPRTLLTPELEEELSGTFVPEDAIKKGKPFLGNQHPLILSIADRLIARAERESFRRCAVKVLPKEKVPVPGLIMTYIVRLRYGENKEVFEEKLVGVFASIDGKVSISEEIFKLIETPSTLPRPKEDLYKQVKNKVNELKQRCDEFIKKWITQYRRDVEEKWHQKLERYQMEISSWFNERRRRLIEAFHARVTLFTLEEESKRLEEELLEEQRRAEALKEKYESLKGIELEDPEPFGLLIILPEE
ncbi:MAG TPA: hypothetical protein ENG13_01685 [bacterium]|nr:hypothetical protein [bacterium]HEX67763.1 hypothetical protein [bacterium]